MPAGASPFDIFECWVISEHIISWRMGTSGHSVLRMRSEAANEGLRWKLNRMVLGRVIW